MYIRGVVSMIQLNRTTSMPRLFITRRRRPWKQILKTEDPYRAKGIGNSIQELKSWFDIQFSVMLEINWSKLGHCSTNPTVLESTDGYELIEDTDPWCQQLQVWELLRGSQPLKTLKRVWASTCLCLSWCKLCTISITLWNSFTAVLIWTLSTWKWQMKLMVRIISVSQIPRSGKCGLVLEISQILPKIGNSRKLLEQ